jgi:hypothetical protein
VNRSTHRKLLRRKRRIERRLARAARRHRARPVPVLPARNVRYEVADRAKAVACGGLTSAIDGSDRDVAGKLLPLVYDELRRLARMPSGAGIAGPNA